MANYWKDQVTANINNLERLGLQIHSGTLNEEQFDKASGRISVILKVLIWMCNHSWAIVRAQLAKRELDYLLEIYLEC